MDRKPIPFIPTESLKTQRVEVYINDLQTRLHQLRNKHDTIFVECCDILKKIQEVSKQTITKQQEIGKIINEFEELGLKTSAKDTILKKALVQKVGDVRRLREKFETIFQENLNELIVRAKCSLENVDRINIERGGESSTKPHSSTIKQPPAPPPLPPPPIANDDERDSELLSAFDSFYSLSNGPAQDIPESLCLEEDEIQGL